ncbi:MAG TPA: FHA domain-containing protein [Polyangiaceae bacterium]
MKFVLRHGPREIALPLGRFVIGRAETCELPLDDPLVSRQHAVLVVALDGVTAEDLGSRNGIRVNGERVEKSRKLAAGDVLVVGSNTFTVKLGRDAMTDTIDQASTQRLPAFGLLGILGEKALALGRADEAERLLGPQLELLLEEASGGRRVDAATVDQACTFSLRLAALVGTGKWIDVVFRLHRILRRTCSTAIVDELYTVLRKVKQPSLVELRQYIAVLREIEAGLGPAERFLVGRLEGLERLLT